MYVLIDWILGHIVFWPLVLASHTHGIVAVLLVLVFFVWFVPGMFLGGIPAFILMIVDVFVQAFQGRL